MLSMVHELSFSQTQLESDQSGELLANDNELAIDDKEEMMNKTESSTEQASAGNLSHLFLREFEVQLKPREMQISIGIDYSIDQNQRSFRANRNRSITDTYRD
jgi:hypothetical protein